MKSGVAVSFPSSLTKNCEPWNLSVTGVNRFASRRTMFFDGSTSESSFWKNSFTPVRISRPPSTQIIQWKRWIAPMPIHRKRARIAIAPRMPQKRTRCWLSEGIAK